MKAQDLKKSILQLAIQGKLVEQDPNDEPATVLLERIKAEKAALVKAGKIKKDKPLPPITDDEIPFDIPDSWMWVYIGDIFQHNTGKALNGVHGAGKMLPYITTSNLYWNRFELDNLKEMPFTETELEKCTVQKGDLLVCEGGDFGRTAVWSFDMPMRIQNHIHRLRPYADIDVNFYYFVFYLYKSMGLIAGKGIGIQGLSSDRLHNILVPLPPLAEQKRIVAKIEELEPLIAEYDTAETALTALNTAFPEQMKKSILQLAIQGKLVEQDPNDESATVLLERIKAEKAALVKAGKIKKDKPLPPITEDEIPFDIPDSWMWVRLGDISNYSSPKKKISPNQITSEMWSLDLEDIEKGTGRIIEKHFAKDRAIQGEKVCFEKGNILYSKLRPYLLKILIAEDNGITSPELIPFNIYGDSYQPFFLWYLRSPYVDSIVNSASYGVKMPRVGTETMIQLLLPLPPLAEQKRIVAKIEELMLLNFI